MKCYVNILVNPVLKFIEHYKCKISKVVLENGCMQHLKRRNILVYENEKFSLPESFNLIIDVKFMSIPMLLEE